MEGGGREVQVTEEQRVPAYLKGVIDQFAGVFSWPKGFPPKRGHEHNIVLKQGSDPVGVRPYRYPQYQKDEIENWSRRCWTQG